MSARPRTLALGVRMVDTRAAPPEAKQTAAIYGSAKWKQTMRRLIAERGRRCEDSAHDGPHVQGVRVYGDHVQELQDSGDLFDPSNILLRCAVCHAKKTARSRAARIATPVGGNRG